MIIECSACRTRTMDREIHEGRVRFVCPLCKNTVDGGGEARKISSGVAQGNVQPEKYGTLLWVAPHSQIMARVKRDCPGEGCGRDYMSIVRVGPEETIVYACVCGVREGGSHA